MEKTGTIRNSVPNALATRCALQGGPSLRRRLLSGLSGAVILAAAALPVTMDQNSFLPTVQTAHAAGAAAGGNETGTGDGRGVGKGNGKGQGGGIGNNGGMNGDDEDHDAGGGGNAAASGGGRDFGESDDGGDADAAASVGAIESSPPGATVPTIQQIFAMDNDSVLSSDQELSAIENGWGTPPKE